MLDQRLLDILACPIDKGPLLCFHDPNGDEFLFNPRLGVRYRVENGVPVLLADRGERVADPARADLLARAAAGDARASAGAAVGDVLLVDVHE